MNIFFLDRSPEQSAVWMGDKHVVKMILESAQLLSTAHRILDGEPVADKNGKLRLTLRNPEQDALLYKATHGQHPSAKWVRQSRLHYSWLFRHLAGLCGEYTHRYGRTHKSQELLPALAFSPHNMPHASWSEPPSCMPDEFKVSDDPVENYRRYYREGKAAMHKWTHREPPRWI